MTLSAQDLKVGDTHEEVVIDDLSRTQLVMYSGVSGDYNPLHTDDIYTREVAGYPSVFAHGMLTMGLTGKMLTNYVGDGRLTKFGVRFTNQVWPGDYLDREGDGDRGAERRVGAIRRSDLGDDEPGRQDGGDRHGDRARRPMTSRPIREG